MSPLRSRALLPLVLLAALIQAPPGSSATATISAASNKYLPADVTVKQGDQIDFVNADTAPHNVISLPARNGGSFRSDTIPQGRTARVNGVNKLQPGKYDFYCSLHPTMIGTLTVQPKRAQIVPHPLTATVAAPTSIAIYQDHLYAASYATNSVHRLPLLPGGALGPSEEYATGFETPLGIAFDSAGTLYVSDSFQGRDRRYGRVRAIPRGGGDAKRVGKVVVTDLPNGRHATNGIAVRSGRLYVTNGNSTDDGRSGGPPETPLSGVIVSVPLSARNVSALRHNGLLTVEARGLRNVFDLAFRPGTGEIWTASNGPDRLEPYGEDLLHRFNIAEGAVNFGFPACIHASSPRGPIAAQNPQVKYRCTAHRMPEITLGMHVSADGLAFGPSGGPWDGDLFIALFGSTDAPPRGHEVVRVPITNGKAGYPESIFTGTSPLDVAFGPAGLYVADVTSGQITLLIAVQ